MKKIIALAAALLSVSSFALSANDSWDTIREEISSSEDLHISSGYSVFMGSAIVTAFDVCVEGENFNTVKPYPVYEIVRGLGGKNSDNFKKVLVGYETLSFPIVRDVTKKVCVGQGEVLCKTVVETQTQPIVRDITVSKNTRFRNGRDHNVRVIELFSKSYEIPACN